MIAALIGAAPGTVLVWSFDSATKAVTVRVKSGPTLRSRLNGPDDRKGRA